MSTYVAAGLTAYLVLVVPRISHSRMETREHLDEEARRKAAKRRRSMQAHPSTGDVPGKGFHKAVPPVTGLAQARFN